MLRSSAAVLCLSAVLLSTAPAFARDFQGSTRFGLGFGRRFEADQERWVFAPSLRADALTVARRFEALRFGPAAELRTSDFGTFEGGAGLALALSLGELTSLVSTSLLGGAYRDDRNSTATAAQIVSLAFRDWDSRPRYAYGLHVFVSARAALDRAHLVEVTGGVEVDLLFLATPFIQLRERIRER